MSKGIIFQNKDKNGDIVKAVALNDDQHSQFSDYGKVFLRILNDDYTFKNTEEGKGVIAVKNSNELTQIGFWD